MQRDLGQGRVTVITDSDLWKTTDIGKHDNAWLLWYLNQGTAVTFLFNSDVDNLLTLLLRYFPQAAVALIALVALALWQAGMRQGPIQAPAPKARRQLQEHLKASADFLLRRSSQGSLLHALQRDIQRAARRRHPGFEHLDNTEQWRVLEHLTRQPLMSSARPLAHSRQNGFPAPISAGGWHACKPSGTPYERIYQRQHPDDRNPATRQPAGPGSAR